MSEHTREPWYVETAFQEPGLWVAAQTDTSIVARLYEQGGAGEANAHRIVACVNCCRSVPTELLETCPSLGQIIDEFESIKTTNADLLAACKTLLGDVDGYLSRGGKLTDTEEAHVQQMRDAVEKAEGRPS